MAAPRRTLPRSGKRLLEVVVAVGAALILGPLMAVLAVAVLVSMGRPVLFRQQRIGRAGRPFCIYKFRTMRLGEAPDADRLTRLGRFLRKTSLDELPQLWNVVRGDMSLVGPRPLLPEYLPRYSPEQARRHEVRPGITGWAQVHGRNAISWEQRFVLDVWYVEHATLATDAAILWRTVARVLRRDGVSAPGAATMPPFAGTPGLPRGT